MTTLNELRQHSRELIAEQGDKNFRPDDLPDGIDWIVREAYKLGKADTIKAARDALDDIEQQGDEAMDKNPPETQPPPGTMTTEEALEKILDARRQSHRH